MPEGLCYNGALFEPARSRAGPLEG